MIRVITEKDKIYARQQSAPILKRKSSRFGLGQLIPGTNHITSTCAASIASLHHHSHPSHSHHPHTQSSSHSHHLTVNPTPSQPASPRAKSSFFEQFSHPSTPIPTPSSPNPHPDLKHQQLQLSQSSSSITNITEAFRLAAAQASTGKS